MDTVMQSSYPSFRNKIALIETIELSGIGFVLWTLIAILSPNTSDSSIVDLFIFLLIIEGAILGSWAIYNLYIRIARAGGKLVDIGLWVIATAATGSYTFWAWTILDGNRFLMSKLLYRGHAPVEYAWSVRSKQVRKLWEKTQKEGYVSSIG